MIAAALCAAWDVPPSATSRALMVSMTLNVVAALLLPLVIRWALVARR